MSLRFIFGPSGAGKSNTVFTEILRRAEAEPSRNFLVIVPDQFTMQTQKDLVMLSGCGGILNIDVLSFGRLTHRILEETGTENLPVLDDTGKCLVLQKVAGNLRNELPVLGGLLARQGYIHEVKSAVSEFMQYGIGTEDVGKLIEYADRRGALAGKLRDLQTLYRGFLDYIGGHFITTEEKLDVLEHSLAKSYLISGSVIVFDGFTGFTPIQYRVIRELMRLADKVIFTVTIGEGEDPFRLDGEQKLFHMSKKTVTDLVRLAQEADVPRGEDVFLAEPNYRFANAPALHHLEQNLFRYPYREYTETQNEIRLFETSTPREEVHQTALEICELIRGEGLSYRDIAVVAGDLEAYAPYVETLFANLQIPCFLDRTRGIALNPMIEYCRSALALYEKDFSYEAVFHYLRSGLSDIAREDIDILENYVIRTGVRGYSRWMRMFTAPVTRGQDEETAAAELLHLNEIRERFMKQTETLHGANKATAADYVERLYRFLVENHVQEKLAEYEQMFEERGDAVRAREYAQIYCLVMELLEQIHDLLGDEEITRREFSEILEAGFGEIEVGTIPQNVDRVVVGDIERTRLKQVKVLFFLGVNDGNIPRNTSKGGIISDMDREFLRESELELAPSPRQQMYIQRFYLYLNMTKPSRRLYLSWAKMDSAGKSVRPAYLVDVVKKIFPALTVEIPQNRAVLEQIVNPVSGREFLAQGLRRYAEGSLAEEELTSFYTLYQAYGEPVLCTERERMREAAFKRYQETGLGAIVARALYGKNLENSVSRLETYAACAYRHFLQYGLTLREREEFGFKNTDLGNVYHGVLELFGQKLQNSDYTWFDFPREYGEQTVRDALGTYAATYGDTVLYSSARNVYAIRRMERILTRTVLTLQEHLRRGSFTPDAYEVSFHSAENLESVHLTLNDGEKMRLRGRIDRVDIAEDAEHVYVKVIDYKSGHRRFNLMALYYGLQLQLVVYLNAAMELEAQKHPDKEIVPAAILYYHIDDPTVETPVELPEEELNQQILAQLKMNGVVNADPQVVERLDKYMRDKSDIIPVERKKDGTWSARSSVMNENDLRAMSGYVTRKICALGQGITGGDIAVNPYRNGKENACTWCDFRKVCGFDRGIPGYEYRDLEQVGAEEIRMAMQEKED